MSTPANTNPTQANSAADAESATLTGADPDENIAEGIGPGRVATSGAESTTRSAMPGWEGGDRVGLIGVDDVAVPYWAQVDQQVAAAGAWVIVRALPGLIGAVTGRAWRIAPRTTALAGVLQLASGVASAFGLLATAGVLTQLLEAGPTPGRVIAALPALAVVVASYAMRGLLETATGAVEGRLAPLVEQAAQDELHAALARVELVAFDDADFVELVNKSGTALNQIRASATTIGDLAAGLVTVAAAVVTAGLLHPALIPVVLLPALPQAWATTRAARLSYQWFLDMTSRARRLSVVGSMLTSRLDAAEVRAFTAAELLVTEHRHLNASLTRDALTVEWQASRIRLAGRALSGIGTGLAYALLGALIYTGALALGLAGAAALAMRTAASAVSTSIYTINRLYESSLHLQLYQRCLTDAATRTRTPPAEPAPVPPGPEGSLDEEADLTRAPAQASWPRWPRCPLAPGAPRRVELAGVSFTYPGQDEPALREIDLTLRAGQVVALVGENGSGKSTLARLISGLYLTQTGTVSWDGHDITVLDPEQLLGRVAIIGQNPTQWPMTAANNIRIGAITRPDPTGAHLAAAARQAGADTVADDLPEGWHAMLSTRFQGGRDLSGGQWQRISIARALYRGANLVVADEPTAALDARAEHAVFQTLRALPTQPDPAAGAPHHDQPGAPNGRIGRITVLITHRLANVRTADQIVVLNHGRIIATGTHDQLISTPGEYRQLFQLQAKAYQEEQ